ncbi:MAG: gamma-glutamyl-gamma-aminobutyrate hydrolase family protein [Myxococcales bacterium]|jgi:putative glutamine amidotransferase|nr:gamma-glutamyl-gamma-aminobutyrate hydrolase family protein [Myxococcales bacterium]
MPLRIGISCGLLPPDPERALFKGKPLAYGEAHLSAAVARAGGLPYLLPDLPDPRLLAALVDDLDALVLSGGSDVSPQTYGEDPLDPRWAGDPERDAYERALISAAVARELPVLGVCRGHQILNAALGGSLYQDIGAQVDGAGVHRDWERYDDNEHPVRIVEDTWLAGVHGAGEHLVNSVHHQAVRALAPGLTASAWSADGLVEALERVDDEHFLVGIQWHPEWLHGRSPHAARRAPGDAVFAAFLAAVAARRELR